MVFLIHFLNTHVFYKKLARCFNTYSYFELITTRHSAVCGSSFVSSSSSSLIVITSVLSLEKGSPSGHGPVSLGSIIGSVLFTHPLCSRRTRRRMYVLKTNNNSLIRLRIRIKLCSHYTDRFSVRTENHSTLRK